MYISVCSYSNSMSFDALNLTRLKLSFFYFCCSSQILIILDYISSDVWCHYYSDKSSFKPIHSTNPSVTSDKNDVFIFLCRFENTERSIQITNSEHRILHSECAFTNNTQPVYISTKCSIVQHRFIAVKSSNLDSSHHSSTIVLECSESFIYIDESSLSQCGTEHSGTTEQAITGYNIHAVIQATQNQIQHALFSLNHTTLT